MTLIKRVFLFLVTNLAVILLLGIIIALIERFFGIRISALGGSYSSILIFAAIYGFAGSFISLFMSKWMAKKSYGVQLFDSNELHSLSKKEKLVYDIVREISNKHGITMPEVGVYESPDPNAFATGASKNSSLVAVSSGLLHHMHEKEIEGVIAHEMAHVLNGDMVTMTLMQGVVNTFVIFISRVIGNIASTMGNKDGEEGQNFFVYHAVSMVLELVLGILASTIVMWFSRYREFRADEGSSRFVGKEKMIAALQALQKMHNKAPNDSDVPQPAMQINTRERSGIMMLFASHPSLEDRIANLENYRM